MDRDLFFFGIVSFLLGFILVRRFAGKVAPDRARALVEQGAKLVDVRTSAEHAAGHIEGSVHVPLGELADRLGELGDKQRPVVVYCASGMRSATAAAILKRAGFAEVHDLGGMRRWPAQKA
jgi:rhodanese-related sulfurtransferase